MEQINFHHLLRVTTAVLLLLLPCAAPDIESDRAALMAFHAAVGGSVQWNLSAASPCSWSGVTCSPENSSVIELRLPGKSLSGQLPPNTISNMTNLQALTLRSNALSGPLPADLFSWLTSLRNLHLQDNHFTGRIPESLFSLTSLVHLNLSDNNLFGPLSPSFNKLTILETLYLQHNHFSGPIPDLKIPSLVDFNVSNNNLTGQIPKGLSGMPVSSFAGNSLCGEPLHACGGNGNLSGGRIAGIAVGTLLGFLLIILLVFCLHRIFARKGTRRRDEEGDAREREYKTPAAMAVESRMSSGFPSAAKERESDGASRNSNSTKRLIFFGQTGWSCDLEDLLTSSAEVLGKGAYGTSYKVVLETGPAVVVKRLRDVNIGEKEFRETVEKIGRMSHKNLVSLWAYNYYREEQLLVYDYVPMGSLSALLHGNVGAGRGPLNWEMRAAIARGAARGILYIHSQGSSACHGNIKSSNILLTTSYEARVSDFGLPQLAIPTTASHHVAAYRAPELTSPHKISQKADVYSFGVLLLELLTGKAPTSLLSNGEGIHLPRWVRSMLREERAAEVLDFELIRYQNVEAYMVQFLQLAVDCAQKFPDNRPSMAEVSSKIEEICSWSLGETTDDIDGTDEEYMGIH